MRKMYVLLFVSACFASLAHAQFKKGDKLLGGSIGFLNQNRSSTDPVSPNTATVFNITPSIGFFTSPDRLIGFSLSYTNETYKYTNTKLVRNGVGAGIYKQYWNSLGKKFYFIMEGNVSGLYAKGSTKQTTNGGVSSTVSEQKALTVTAGIVPGISYQITKRLTTDMFFSNFLYFTDTYSKNKDNYPGIPPREYTNNSVGFGTGFTKFSTNNLQFGFRYILN